MYGLLAIDALARIVLALAFLFVLVPALAWPRTPATTAVERFFWNYGVGVALITLTGQVLSLGNLYSPLTILCVAALVVVIGRARQRSVGPLRLVRLWSETALLAFLNIFDRRVHVLRRIRRAFRRALARFRAATSSDRMTLEALSWTLLAIIAAALRLYRPFTTANLGYSDTYVHLYLFQLLDGGQQVDPAFGPYPRGMHFLLLTIHHLTNVDPILLMNFFGSVVGVLMTLAVADAARRLSGSVVAALLAGFLFATLVGGPRQYFVLGGAFSADRTTAASLRSLSYEQLSETRGEFDVLLVDFQRQSSTLSQEMAISLLYPAGLFLLGFLRNRRRWELFGYIGCTAAVAAVHSGVVVPLVLMSAVAVAAAAIEKRLTGRTFAAAAGAGVGAVALGSAWMLAFLVYRSAGGKSHAELETSVGTAIFYYFPFLRPLADGAVAPAESIGVAMTLTPFLIVCAAVAAILLAGGLRSRDEAGANRAWIGGVFLLLLLVHIAAAFRLPQILEPTRNSQWLLMAMCTVLAIGAVDLSAALARWKALRLATAAAVVIIPFGAAWASRVPALTDPLIRQRLVNYSGYGGSALAVLRIARTFEPYTWTLVSYGQEFPMVLRKGFHIPAASFLERYDPAAPVVPIPTPHIFVIVEKTPHPFQINTWAQTYSRSDLEQRLQTWVHVYQATHTRLRVFYEDEHVRVYQITRSAEEIDRLVEEGQR